MGGSARAACRTAARAGRRRRLLPPPGAPVLGPRGPARRRSSWLSASTRSTRCAAPSRLAARGSARTSPNPRRGRRRAGRRRAASSGEGWHRARRRSARRGRRARGGRARLRAVAPLVVTLEPCRHTGRTGPCTDALARAPASPGSSSPCATPTRAGRWRCAGAAGAGRRRRGRGAGGRGRGGQRRRGWRAVRRQPPVRDLEVRRHPRRPVRRRRRHQPLDHRPRVAT